MGYKDILRSVANINADNRKKQEEERRKKKATGSSNVERSVNNTAPAATRGGSGRLGAVTKATSQSAATGNDTYFEEEQRTSERMKNRRTYTQQDYGVRGDRVLPSGYSDNKVRSTSRQGAGKLKTTFANGTARYQYERNGNNANVPYGYTAAENGTWQQRKSSPVANKLADKVGVDRTARYMTQETDHTVKYDDGKRTEYFEIQGSGSNAHLVSVPEERYYQRQQLDGGLNPSTVTPYNRLRGAAEHGIKNAVHGMKSTIGSIKANTNEEQRAYDYMSRTDGGNSLNRRRNMLMESYGAGSAAQRGDVRKARTYINQETFDDAMNERRQLEEQKRLDQMYQAYKAGASRPMQLAMDVVDTTANMAPGMVSNVLLPGSFIPEMAVQAYGNSYNQARNNGATREQAILSGIQNAAVESLSEMMFAGGRALGKATGVRGIFHPGREIEEASLGFIKSTAGKDVIRAVQKLGLAGSEEGAEEIVAGLVEPVLDTLIYQGGVDALKDKDFWTNTVHEALYNGLVGFASGGGFGAVDVVQSIRQGADIRANADVANMINQGLAMPEDTKVYSLARSLDNQIKAGQSLGNLDVSDLSRAMQEGQAEINKKYQREAKTTDEAINKNRLFHRTESAQASYERAMESEEEAEQAIAKGASEQEAAEIKASMSKQGAEYGEYLRDARTALAKRLMPAMAEEVSEDPDVVEANRADAERQAEDGARTIARVMMGEATVEDFQKFGTTNPALREAYEEIAGVSIPEGNKATVDFMINQNEIHYIAEQRNDKARVMLEYADAVFGDKSAASEAFRKSVGDLSKMDENELEGVIRGFSDAYTIGRASEPDAVLPRKTDMMKFLSDEQIEAAFQAGKNDRLARSEMVKDAEEEIAAAKKNGKRKPKIKHDVMSNLNEEERSSEKAKQAAEDMQILQDALNVKITLETARTTADSGNPESSEGWYDKDGIHLNIDADTKVKPLEVVFSHEFTHHLQRYAPKEYQALVEFVIEAKTNNNMQAWERMVEQKIVDYGNADVQLTRDQAIDEIVADMAYEFLNNEQTVERLFAYDATLAEKIKKVMLNMIDKILKFFKTHGSQWKGMESELKTARQMWLDAADVARENAGLDIEGGTQLSMNRFEFNRDIALSNMERVVEADNVASLKGNEFVVGGNDLVDRVDTFFQNIGGIAHNELLGDVILKRRGARSSLGHGIGQEKAAAFAAVPDIIKNGYVIDAQKNWKNRGYDTAVVCAPIKIDGKEYFAAVIVERRTSGKQYYYLHEVELKEKSGFDAGTVYNPATASSTAPIRILLQLVQDVNAAFNMPDTQVGDAYKKAMLKNTKKIHPTDESTLQFSLSTDSTGRQLTKGQQEYFKDSKIRDEQGRLKVMYHGTNNEFTVFDFNQGGKNGTAEGYGIYTSDRKEVSGSYGGRLIEGYVNITRPAASDQKTIKRDELKRLIRATVDAEAERLADDYDGDIAAAAKDSWISNYTYTYDKSLDAAIDEVAGTILNLNDNDMDIVQEVMGGMAIRDYDEAVKFYGMLTDVTGIDGFVTDWEDSNTGESSQIALAFRSNQIKNVTNESPTKSPDIRYSISTPMKELDHTDKTVTDTNGEPVAKFDRAGGVQFSISTYEDKGRAVLNKYLDKMLLEGELDQDEAEQIRTEMEKIYDICKDYADTGKYIPFSAWSSAEVVTGANGRPIFSAVKNNSEYKMNMDFSTICKKRRTLDAIFNELVNRGFFDRFDLNKEDSAAFVVKMNDIIRKNGFEAACALCFVEARRYRQQQTAMTFRDMWNDLVKSMYKDESKISHFNFGQDSTARMVEDGIHTMKDSELDLTYVKKMAKGKGVPARAAKLLLEDPSQRKLMRTGDMMSSVGFENFQVKDPKLMKIYNAKKGTGGAKSSFGDVQYFHEIIGSRNKTFNRNKAYKVGGVRIQSFSDYVPRMVFDYVEMVADLAAKRLPAHAYTKEALFAKQFGLTGIKINLSLVPDVIKGAKVVGLDKDGNYAWNVEGTFPYDEAEKLIHAEGYKENVGTIAVGVSDEQIRKMLADPNIMMVIPYHKSSLNPIVAEMTNVDAFTDYTDFQNTKDETGKTVKRDFDWDGKLHKLSHGKDGKLLPKEQWGDIQDVVREYADWCKARNYTPKFSQFLYMEDGSINPGYYKMLEDFSLLTVDGEFTPQDDVRMKFPTEADAFGSMADLIAEGLDADAVLEGKRSKKVVPIADEIEELAESGELLSNLNQHDVDIVKNFMETTDITKGHAPQFSLASDRDRELADLQKKIDRLQRDKRRTYGREAKEGDAVRVAKAILEDTSSDFSLNQTIKGIKNVFQMIKRGDDFAEIYGEIQGISRSIADSSFDMVEIPGAREEAELRQRFLDARKKDGRPLKILIPQNLIGDFDRVGGWKEFRAAHKGIVTLSVNDGLSYDTFVDSIAEEFGEQYRAEGDNSGIDSLINIIETADSQDARHPERKAYKDEDIDGSIPDDVDMGVMGGYRDAEVNSIIDRLLDDISTEIAPDLTFADRKASEKDEAVRRATTREREKWEARREKWKADRDKRIAEMREDKKLAVEAQRAQGKERLRKQAEMYRRQRERAQQKRADNTSRRKTLNRIYTTAQRLSKKLLTPTDSQHVPEKYRKAVAEVLGWLDFENARTDQWAKRHGNVPSDRILNLRKLRELYAGIANDEQLSQYIEPDDQVYEWMDMLSDLDGTRLDDLETDQLRTVRLILDAVAWQVNNADKMMTEGMKQNRADMATQIMDELAAQKGEKFADSTFKRLMKADSTPAHFFERLGSKTLQKLFKGLTDAQDRHIRNLSEAQDYIEKNVTSKWGNTRKVGPNNSLIKKWTEESQKYTLENGKTVEMTGAQVMSLYALNKREQARKHLLGGGIMIAPTKVKRNLKGGIKEYLLERELSKTRAQLTYADITGILGKMSQDQIDCAEAMLKYLKTTSEWGNETSMKMFGYRKFTEENYFPIQSAKEFIANSNLELQRDKKIKNQGMTKNVSEYANNPIVIDDFFDVTTAHINQMSQYNAFVPILEDFDRIYQYTEFNDKHIVQRSVKEMIEQKHGRWAADYIENLLKNVNGNFGNEVADIQGFEKLLRNWKAAKIGMSVRVLAQQPTAVVRAFNEIDPKYFVGTPKKGSHKRMWEICPIAEWKNWGYAQTDIHRSMRDTMLGDKHISDKLFFDMYGKADNLGWGMIFDAVERETKALMKKGKLNFEYDSAEYRQHVNDRFRHIVDRTQVVDSVLHRSQLMRSQSTVMKAMTAFMAEPTITVNTIMTSFTKAQEEARAGHKAAATKAASKGIAVFVANAVAVSLMSSLISAIRESYLPGDDDDDKEKELSWLQQRLVDLGFEEGSLLYDWISGYFIEDFKSNINPLCLVPISKDMINMLEGYDAPNPLYQLPESLIKNTQNIKKWVDENGDTRYSGRYYIERAAESLAELFGVPAANIRKELIGFQNIYFRAISEKEYGDYLQDRWELNEEYSSNKNTFIDHYLNAKKADHDESAKDIKEQLLQSKARNDDGDLIFTEDAIQKRAWSVYAPNYKDDVIAGKDVSRQERDLLKVGVSQNDIDDKKSKALKSAVGDAVAEGDIDRLEDLRGSLADYGMGDYDVDKKIKSEANDMLYDAIDAGDYKEADKYIKIITDGTEFTRDDVVSTITSHYMSDYYEAMDAGDNKNRKHYESILKKYGMSDQDINIAEGSHYKDYYKSKVYEALERGDTDEAYRIANLYIDRYPYKKENGEVKPNFKNGAEGMIYGLSRTDDAKIREYTTSDKYVNWDIPR